MLSWNCMSSSGDPTRSATIRFTMTRADSGRSRHGSYLAGCHGLDDARAQVDRTIERTPRYATCLVRRLGHPDPGIVDEDVDRLAIGGDAAERDVASRRRRALVRERAHDRSGGVEPLVLRIDRQPLPLVRVSLLRKGRVVALRDSDIARSRYERVITRVLCNSQRASVLARNHQRTFILPPDRAAAGRSAHFRGHRR